MLRDLFLDNVKGFRESHELNLAPITLLYGPNSAGKSTLLQSLMLLKQTFESADLQQPDLVVRGNIVDLGSVPGILHGHDTKRTLGLGIRMDSVPSDGMFAEFEAPNQIDFRFRWDGQARAVRQSAVSYSVDGRQVAGFTRRRGRDRVTALDDDKPDYALRLGRREARERFIDWIGPLSYRTYGLTPSDGQDAASELKLLRSDLLDCVYGAAGYGLLPNIPQFRAPRDADQRVMGAIRAMDFTWMLLSNEFRQRFMNALEQVAYLGPLRHAPQRFHQLSGAKRRNVGSKGEYVAEVLTRDRLLMNRLNDWMERFEIPYDFVVDRLEDAQTHSMGDVLVTRLVDRHSGLELGVGDVGFGISLLLPILVQCLVRSEAIVCVEQPEIHLHPRLQAHLADLFIESALGPVANQVIVETHSEHLMLRLQRRMREGRVRPSDVSVVYVDAVPGEGSRLVPIPLDDDGSFLRDWPNGFFPERLDEKTAHRGSSE